MDIVGWTVMVEDRLETGEGGIGGTGTAMEDGGGDEVVDQLED